MHRQTSRLLDRIGPVGHFNENLSYQSVVISQVKEFAGSKNFLLSNVFEE